MLYMMYKRSEKIWQSYQKNTKENEDPVKYTLNTIYRGLSKSMQAQYAFHETPASLWEELKRMKDPSNRKMDTSSADTYRTLKIGENQLVPGYIKCILEVKDTYAAAGETLHLGLESQLQTMIDLWVGYKAALELNKPSGSKTTANVTIGNPDHKRKTENKEALGIPERIPNAICAPVPTTPNMIATNGNMTIAAMTTANTRPKHLGWVPTSGLLNIDISIGMASTTASMKGSRQGWVHFNLNGVIVTIPDAIYRENLVKTLFSDHDILKCNHDWRY
ncbi:hypothetical protein BJ741DRAFT_684958 [Chytriomyces cf. hyalinus JEL632]|nr:hypothetical protein BJ741DRAFT_684958 [Chytriomyces cf. hyalinus JEL632]